MRAHVLRHDVGLTKTLLTNMTLVRLVTWENVTAKNGKGKGGGGREDIDEIHYFKETHGVMQRNSRIPRNQPPQSYPSLLTRVRLYMPHDLLPLCKRSPLPIAPFPSAHITTSSLPHMPLAHVPRQFVERAEPTAASCPLALMATNLVCRKSEVICTQM